MIERIRTSLLSLAIITVLIFSAVSPGIAFADEGKTSKEKSTEVTKHHKHRSSEEGSKEVNSSDAAATPAPTEATSEDGSATAQSTEAAPVEATATPAPTEEAAPTEAATTPETTDAAAPTEGQATSDSNSTDLSAVPDNTSVTVLDQNGNAQPLATQDAATAIATSDPIWCPGTQSPTPGANGCTQSFPSFDELLKFLSGNASYSGTGTIYVQQGNYTGSDPNHVIDLNSTSYDLSNIHNSDLTITGGWNTSSNTVDPTQTSNFSNYSILIGSSTNPWGGSLTINNLNLDLTNVTDPTVNGITAYSNGSITVSNVSVSTAPNNGIELHADGDVNMQNSKFSRNDQAGAVIRAKGNVNIANSDFSNPGPTRRRQDIGLDIVSGQATSLFGVIANHNRRVGTNIDSTGRVTIANSVFNFTQDRLNAATGNSVFNSTANPAAGLIFMGYGLNVVTPDAIDMLNVTANENYLWGAKLNAGGDIAISDSVFNANSTSNPNYIDDTGLFITGGNNVALNNVTANDNRLYGTQINVNGTVSINNSNFNNNRGVTTTNGVDTYYGHGMQIITLSDIFINNTNATGNQLFGGQLNAGGEVAISNSNFSDTSTTLPTVAVGKGLEIVSAGNISLSSVVLGNNQTVGADIQSQGNIYLDSVTATNNGTDGVAVQTACTHVNGGLYSGNGQYGLNLGSSGLDMTSPAIFTGNGAGNTNPASPVSCPPAVSTNNASSNGGTVSTPVVVSGIPTDSSAIAVSSMNADSSNNLFAGNYYSGTASSGLSAKNISLLTFLANSTIGFNGSQYIFTGTYAYVESDNGLQVVAFVPVDDGSLAMSMP